MRARRSPTTLTVKAIKRRVQPELNDDFAKELGDYSSYEDFTTKFRENLQAEKERRTETDTRERLLNALSERFQFPVPESMVQQQIDARLDRGLRALASAGHARRGHEAAGLCPVARGAARFCEQRGQDRC